MTNKPQNDDRPNIEEQYTSATHASSLVVDPDHSGSADKLIASAWSPSRLGSSLLRLHSEADGTPDVVRLHERGIEIMAAVIARERCTKENQQIREIKKHKTPVVRDEDMLAARRQAGEWYLHEQGLRLQRLKTLPEVRHQLAMWALLSDIPQPLEVVAGALMWWLSNTCHVCNGQRWEVFAGTGRLSQQPCQACEGTGKRVKPHGALTSKVISYIGDCINASRAGMSQRLNHYKPKKD
jgi:hypothetical protein